MTPEQQNYFIKAAQFGIACGLQHRYEWFVNANRALIHGDYSHIEQESKNILDAFIAFERGTCGCPEDEQFLKNLTDTDFIKLVNDFYANARRQNLD